jgi:hypothetical protein
MYRKTFYFGKHVPLKNWIMLAALFLRKIKIKVLKKLETSNNQHYVKTIVLYVNRTPKYKYWSTISRNPPL